MKQEGSTKDSGRITGLLSVTIGRILLSVMIDKGEFNSYNKRQKGQVGNVGDLVQRASASVFKESEQGGRGQDTGKDKAICRSTGQPEEPD